MQIGIGQWRLWIQQNEYYGNQTPVIITEKKFCPNSDDDDDGSTKGKERKKEIYSRNAKP